MKVKTSDIINCIKLAYQANKPVLLQGPHGVGKSQIIEAAAKALGVDCIVRDLSLMEAPDLVGLLYQENGRTKYSPPAFLPTDGKGLLVFEELNRSERYMMSPCLQLLTARCLNDYRLPDGWLPVAAINPSGDGYDVNELDPALLSRFLTIEVVPDVKSWIEWGKTVGTHHAILRFVGQTADIFAASDSNPRAWTWASDVLKTYEQQGGSNESLLTVTLAGLVGDALAVGFVQSYLRGEEAIRADDILNNYEHHRSTIRHWVSVRKVDCLNATLHGALVSLQDVDVVSRVSGSADETQNLGAFAKDLPADMGKKLRKAAKEAGVRL